MKVRDFLFGTLGGHIVLAQSLLGIPAFVLGVVRHSAAGTLSPWMWVELVVLILGACTLAAAGLWFTVTRDLARQRWPNGPPK